MPSLATSYSAFANAVYSTARSTSRHVLSPRVRHSSTLLTTSHLHSEPQAESSSGAPQTPFYREFSKEKQLEDLKYALSHHNLSPSVWTHYTSLMNVAGYDKLPSEIHQTVLRRCTPSFEELRRARTRQIHSQERIEHAHVHEARFQTVIRNMRASGATPDLEDYHFILEQFSAVGHHFGAMNVYKELVRMGVTPRTKTFGLMFRTIAQQLAFPIPKKAQPKRASDTRQMLSHLMSDMQNYNIRFTSVNLDLIIRILKETLDMPSLEMFMRAGYGIDINNPDHPPVKEASITTDLGLGLPAVAQLHPQPISTAALNTILDILGTLDNISKMIQTFEVLTQPLPVSSVQFSSFDDDDDFGPGSGTTETRTEVKPIGVVANSTTYCILLRHICRAGKISLARHYLNEVMFLDRYRDWGMRKRIFTANGLKKVTAPRISINRGMIVPALGQGNRNKNLNLLRWLATKMHSLIRRKKENIEWYSTRRHIHKRMVVRKAREKEAYPRAQIKAEVRAADAVSGSRVRAPSPSPGVAGPSSKQTLPDLFELDITSEELPRPEPLKPFDIDLHIRILKRDLEELQQFDKYVRWTLGRTTQRVKERLGRRVWAGKDVYLASAGARVRVDKEQWRSIVNFQPRKIPADGVPTSALPTRRNRAKPLKPMHSAKHKAPKLSKFFDRNDVTLQAPKPQHGIFKDLSLLQGGKQP